MYREQKTERPNNVNEYERILRNNQQLFAFMEDAMTAEREDILKCTDILKQLSEIRNYIKF